MLKKQLSKLSQKIRSATNPKQRKKFKARKKQVKLLRQNFAGFTEECQQLVSPDGEFRGAAELLTPYRENLTTNEINHLLKRVAFGGNVQLFAIGKNQGLSALVTALVDGVYTSTARQAFENKASQIERLYSYYDSDELRGKQVFTTEAVTMGELFRMVYSEEPMKEWMTLLLSGHFAVNLYRVGFSYSTYGHRGLPDYVKLIRDNALGSFSSIALGMLWDKSMNVWLDNRDNRAGSPNQNFARELLELFLLGAQDPITATANYDEDSVIAATAFVSGFYETEKRDSINGNNIMDIAYSDFDHDTADYTIFGGINGAGFTGTMAPEEFVSYILYSHRGSARFIAERFAGRILYPGLTEAQVQALADLLVAENFNLKEFLKTVLKSQAMFSEQARSSCISSPIEQFVRLARKIYPALPQRLTEADLENYYSLFYSLHEATSNSGQALFQPPSVFAWKGDCNLNRNGAKSYGEGWVTMQKLVGRIEACGDLFSTIIWRELDLMTPFSLAPSANADQIITQVSRRLNVPISTSIRPTLINYLNTELEDDGSPYERTPDLAEDWYRYRKLPRLACLLTGLPEFYMN